MFLLVKVYINRFKERIEREGEMMNTKNGTTKILIFCSLR